MSVIPSIEPTRDVDATIDYLYYGDEREHAEPWRKKRSEHLCDGTDRAAYVRSTCGSRQQFAQACKAHGRKVKAYTFVQSFAPEEFDWRSPEDVSEANALGFELAQRLYPGCDVLVITHVDGSSRAVHNHIVVSNDWYDLGAGKHRAITQNRKLTQVRAENDRLMEERGRESLGRRAFSWAEKRKSLKRGSFDLALGDAVARAKAEAIDMDDFRRRLVDEGVELHLGSGATYKMRHGGRLRRRSATRLADEFRIDQLELHFEAIAQHRAVEATREEQARRAQRRTAQVQTEEAMEREEVMQELPTFPAIEAEDTRSVLGLLREHLPKGFFVRHAKVAADLRDKRPQFADRVHADLLRQEAAARKSMEAAQSRFYSAKSAEEQARNASRLWERVCAQAIAEGNETTALVALALMWFFASRADRGAADEVYRSRAEMWASEKAHKAAERALEDYENGRMPKDEGEAQDEQRDEFQQAEDKREAQAAATAEPDAGKGEVQDIRRDEFQHDEDKREAQKAATAESEQTLETQAQRSARRRRMRRREPEDPLQRSYYVPGISEQLHGGRRYGVDVNAQPSKDDEMELG